MGAEPSLTLLADGEMATLRIIESMFRGRPGYSGVSVVCDPSSLSLEQLAQPTGRLLMVRLGSPEFLARVTEIVRAGIPYAYYLDDNFWLLNGDSPLHRYYQNPLVRQSLERALAGASVVICHSELFREQLLRFNRNVVVLPPHFDFELLGPDPVDRGELRVGVVGNASRASDIAFLVDVVRGVLARAPGPVVFEFFGHTPDELAADPHVRSLPPVGDYAAFIRAQQQRGWTLALAPLMDTPFARFKTNNKFREFGACGIPAIYSETPVYRECVDHGRTGWILPNRAEDWVELIVQVLADPGAARQVGAAAKAAVRARHDAEVVHAQWVEVLEGALRPNALRAARIRAGRLALGVTRRSFSQGRLELNARTGPLGWRGKMQMRFGELPLFRLDAGEALQCTFRPFTAGSNVVSLLVATYARKAAGTLAIAIEHNGAKQQREISLEPFEDGESIPLVIDASSLAPLTVTIRSASDGPLAFYGCTRLATTRYEGGATVYPVGVLA